jgi:hypothetical protein
VLHRFRSKSGRGDGDSDVGSLDWVDIIDDHDEGTHMRGQHRANDNKSSSPSSILSSSLSSSLLHDNDDGRYDDSRMDQPFVREPTPSVSSSALAMVISWLLDYVQPLLPRIELLGAGFAMARYAVYMRQLAVEGLTREEAPRRRTSDANLKPSTGVYSGATSEAVLSIDKPAPEYMSPLMAIIDMWVWAGPPPQNEEDGEEQNRRSRWYNYSISTVIVIIAAITVLVRHQN